MIAPNERCLDMLATPTGVVGDYRIVEQADRIRVDRRDMRTREGI